MQEHHWKLTLNCVQRFATNLQEWRVLKELKITWHSNLTGTKCLFYYDLKTLCIYDKFKCRIGHILKIAFIWDLFYFFCFFFLTGKDITDEVLKNAVAPKKCITIQPQIVFEYDVNYTTPVRNKAWRVYLIRII